MTGAASAELSPRMVERVARRALTYLEDEVALELLESADTLRGALDAAPLERVEDPDVGRSSRPARPYAPRPGRRSAR